MRDLDTKLLRSFVHVARSGSMTLCARQTHQTQGAVSQQIKRLEDLFGQKLFLRSRGGLTLTAGGALLLPAAEEMIAACDQLFDRFDHPDAAHPIRFGIPYDLVSAYLEAIMGAFSASFPDLDVDLHCEASPDLKARAKAGELDLVLIEEPMGQAEGEILRVEPLVWMGKRGGRAHSKRPLPVSLVAEACVFKPSVEAALAENGIAWRPVFENGDLSATMATVRSDMAVTSALRCFAPPDLLVLPNEAHLPRLGDFAISLFPNAAGLTPAARELAQIIRQTLA